MKQHVLMILFWSKHPVHEGKRSWILSILYVMSDPMEMKFVRNKDEAITEHGQMPEKFNFFGLCRITLSNKMSFDLAFVYCFICGFIVLKSDVQIKLRNDNRHMTEWSVFP